MGDVSDATGARLRTALEVRDGGRCRFPGCEARRCDAHHVVHWSKNGETKLENLILLCRVHHRLVHEGGFRVERVDSFGPAGGGFRFWRPDGRELVQSPALEVVEIGSAATGAPSGDACLAVEALAPWHDQAAIDPEAMIARGLGERVDYSWAISEWRAS